MRLDSISLKNFRLFPELRCSFHPELTVFVAENGGGKTTILDAIRILFDTYLGAFPTGIGKGIKLSDVRMARSTTDPLVMTPAFPSEIHGKGSLADNEPAIAWSRAVNTTKSGTTMKDARALAIFGKQLQDLAIDPEDRTDWPLLAYYGTGRLWSQKKLTSGKLLSSGFHTRAAGYIDCMEPASSYKLFVDWFSYAYRSITQEKIRFMEARPDATAQEIIGLESAYSPLVSAVREAVDIVLRPSGWKKLWYSETKGDVTVNHDELGTLSVGQLSDGIRNSIALVADIAFRAVQLNPHLGASAARETAGIVLIDEVDMHLHPSWQQVILQLLKEAFPRIQFVVTTHSPQVLTSVDASCIRILGQETDPGTGAQHAAAKLVSLQTKGVASSDLLAQIMGVDPTPDVPEARMLSAYIALIQQNLHESTDAQGLRAQLNTHFGALHPAMLECDRLIRLQAFKQMLPLPRRGN